MKEKSLGLTRKDIIKLRAEIQILMDGADKLYLDFVNSNNLDEDQADFLHDYVYNGQESDIEGWRGDRILGQKTFDFDY